jgi:two-component system cell cycle sensor histidine kinase PleC
MSHELRTPLNAILGFSELIRDRTDGPLGSDKYETYIGDIHSSAGSLLELVNEALELSKIEADAIVLEDSPVEVAAAVCGVLRLVQEEAAGGGIAISTDFSTARTVLKADDRIFRQLLLILLSKTVKLAGRGQKITVSTSIEPDGRLALRLAGLDLDPQEALRLTADFDQVDPTLANRQKASGFGLGVARPLIELHGGTLEIQSQNGGGVTVSAYFPKERLIAA